MRKFLLAGLLAAAALAALPDQSRAGNRDPNNHGFRWLGALAYRSHSWIHQSGPLFNYGPYNTQGLVTMHIPQPYHGTYMPADQSLWNRTYYGVPAYPGYPPYGYAPGYAPGAPMPGPAAQPGVPPRVVGPDTKKP